jgi:hypothetical protein
MVKPMGDMTNLASAGYGGLLNIGLSGRRFSLGLETGFISYTCEKDVKSMYTIPALLEFGYRQPLFFSLSLCPSLKAGMSYDVIDYTMLDAANPLISRKKKSSGFDPAGSAALSLQWDVAEKVNVFGGAEYSVIYQKDGTMSWLGWKFGAGVIF